MNRHSGSPAFGVALLWLLLSAGCTNPTGDSKEDAAKRPLEGVALRLAVVDDPAMAAAIMKIRGEWNMQTGSELQIVETTAKNLTQAEALPADAVVCPSCLLGVLAERGWLAPVPPAMLHNTEWTGIFELLRLREAAWGEQIMAIPFGSPVFCCYYRADLLDKLRRRPPKTWAEYQELATLLAEEGPIAGKKGRSKSPLSSEDGAGVRASWSAALEPLAPGWAGLVLLARAAPYLKHRSNYSALFDIETMEPLVAGPPMVQALEELVAAAKLASTDPLQCDPAAVRAAFWKGQCGLALTWASRGERPVASGDAKKATDSSTDRNIRLGVVELPGSRRVYSPNRGAWDQRAATDDSRVPLLAVAGRLGVVAKGSAHTEPAFRLLLWLSDSQRSPQISAVSPATTLFRQSNLQSPGVWVEKPAATAALVYADATEAALRHDQWLGALRLPGRAEYLAALDTAVAAAVRGKRTPQQALQDAAVEWKTITQRYGTDCQADAYRHSLGLE
jgi:ABC-type glycerol-3-phosphate transport system substrate-binding protein